MGKTNNSLFHKILVTVLAVSLILGNISIYSNTEYAYADGDESGTVEPWNGESIKTPQQDSQGYYLITTAAELAGFASLVNDDYNLDAKGKLTADIDLGSCEWTPIGNENSDCYRGTFDGQGHTISNLQVSKSSYCDYAGLFGWASNATISNLTVTGSVYGSYAGGILGSAEGKNVTISQCINEAEISGKDYAGGILGAAENYIVTISQCKNEGNISSNDYIYTGGILGYGIAEIEECVNTGKITSGYSAGGIAGAGYSLIVSYSYNSGEISGEYASGIVGSDEGGDIELKSIYSSATITYKGSKPKFDGVEFTAGITGNSIYGEICIEENEDEVEAENVFGYTSDYYENFLIGYQALNQWFGKTMKDLTDALNDGGTAFTYKEGAWPILTWEAQSGAVDPEELAAAITEAKAAIKAACNETSEYDAICGQKARELVTNAETSLDSATTLREVEKIKTETVTALNDIPTSAYKETKKSALDKYLEGNYNADEWAIIAKLKTDLSDIVTRSVSVREIDEAADTANTDAADVITADKKKTALESLDTAYNGYKEDDYSEGNWESLVEIYTKAKADINASHSDKAINGDRSTDGILEKACGEMKAVKNKLDALRSEKAAEFTNYFNENYKQSDYSDEKWKQISNPKSNTKNKGYYNNALSNIKTANSEEEIDQIVATAKENMAKVYTLVKEAELASYKTRLKAELDSRFNELDSSLYKDSDYSSIQRSVNSQKNNIESSNTFEDADKCYQFGIEAIQQTITTVQRQEQLERIEAVYQSCLTKKDSYDDSEWKKIEDAYNSKSSLNSFSGISYVKNEADSIIRKMNNAMTKEELADFETSRSDMLALLKAEYDKYEAKKSDYDQSCKADEEGWAKLESIYKTAIENIKKVEKDKGKSAMTEIYEQAAADMAAVVSLKAKRESCESELKVICGGYVTSGLYNDTGKTKLNAIANAATSDMAKATSVKAINDIYEAAKTELANVTEASGESTLKAAITAAKAAFSDYFNKSYPDINKDKYETEDWTKLHDILTETLSKMDAVYTKSYAEDLAAIEKAAKEELGKITLKNEKLAALIAESMKQLGKVHESNTKLLDAAKENLFETFASFAHDLFVNSGENALTAAIDAAKAKLTEIKEGAKALLESLGSSKEITDNTEELLGEMESTTQKALTIENTVAEADKWNGKKTSEPEGSGTQEAPYIIDNAAELAWFAQAVNEGKANGAYAKLGADIDLAGYPWTAIGTGGLNSKGYTGCFDGDGHTIHNLYVSTEGMSGSSYGGLFGTIGVGGTVKNLHIAGEIHFTEEADNAKDFAFGGIAGYVKESVIYNCVSSLKITRDKFIYPSQIGGIAGKLSGGTIERCVSYAAFIENDGGAFYTAGGIAGSAEGSSEKYAMIRYCTYDGSINTKGSSLGGIAGQISKNAIIRECINNAAVGNGEGGTANAFVGGIAGFAKENAKLMYVYNHGKVTGDTTTSGQNNGAGGIVGMLGQSGGSNDINENPLISYAYNDAKITAPAKFGGLVGRVTAGTISESQSCSDNNLFGYVENAGTNVDSSILTDSISFVSTGSGNSSELALAKFDGTQLLLAKYRKSGDSVYGTQTKAYNDLLDGFVRKIEEAKDSAAIDTILAEAETKLAEAKTQLDADKEELISELKLYVASRVYDSKKAEDEEKSIAQQVTELLDTAVSEVEAATSVAEVKNIREKYLGTEETAGEFAYFETYDTQTIKGLYSDFIYGKAYTAEDLAKVQTAYDKWAVAIKAAESEKRINELAAEAKKELTELTKDMKLREEVENSELPSFAGGEEDSLKAEKEKAYKTLADKYNWKDYGSEEWKEISSIFAALQTSLNAADTAEKITEAANAAKTQLDAVQTLETQALALAAQDAKKTLGEKISELIEKLGKFFSGKNEEIGEDKVNASPLKASLDKAKVDGETAIANAGKDADGNELTFENKTLAQIRETLDSAIEKAESAFNSAKQKLQSLFEKVGANDENAWDGESLSKPVNGKGTTDDPYQITNGSELAWFAALVNGEIEGETQIDKAYACALLMNDINLGYRNWTPIGKGAATGSSSETRNFRGSFDGKGHKVEGMYIADAAEGERTGYYGLFGYIYSGNVSNLSLEGRIELTVEEKENVGGIVGYAYGGKIENCISDVEMNLEVTGRDTKGYGGIAGRVQGTKFVDCENKGNISVSCEKAGYGYASGLGGIVGYVGDLSTASTVIERCINNGELYAYKAVGTGGIVGYANDNAISVSECVNTANITVEEATDIYGTGGTGGIIGAAVLYGKNGEIKDVYNTGTIKAQTLAGGILGGERTGYQQNSSTGSGLTESISSGAANLTLAYAYNAGLIDGPNAQVSNKLASVAGLPIAGSYMTKLFMVEGTAKSAMGYISTKGNKITTISSAELKKMAAKEVFSADSSAVESIADINNGYPIFAWQLLMSENRSAVKKYLNDYYEKYVKAVASEAQCKQIESVLSEKLATIVAADSADKIISAYNEALAAMNVEDVLEQAREDASDRLGVIEVSKYPKHLQTEISALLALQRQKIEQAENAKEMDDIVDAAYAGIVDILIKDIDEPEFNPVSATEAAASTYKEKTELSKSEYDKLTSAQKELVTAYIKVTQAEANYQEYLDRSAAKAVDDLIAAIGAIREDSGAKIKAARDAYEALSDSAKKYVTMISILKKAETAYAKLHSNETAADEVVAKIDAIGKVSLDSYDKIMAAMKAYNALTQNQAKLVPQEKVDKLKAAMAKYNALLEAAKTGNVIISVTPTVNDGIADAQIDKEILADAIDTVSQISANALIIKMENSGEKTDEIQLKLKLDELESMIEEGKTSLKIETIFGQIKLTPENLKQLLSESKDGEKLVKINANGDNLGFNAEELTDKENKEQNKYPSNSKFDITKYPQINGTLNFNGQLGYIGGETGNTDTVSAQPAGDDKTQTDELVQISDKNPMAEPKKPFDWSILLMLVGIAAALGIGGGMFKWFTAARGSRKK